MEFKGTTEKTLTKILRVLVRLTSLAAELLIKDLRANAPSGNYAQWA